MVFPHPTSPYMYKPLGRSSEMVFSLDLFPRPNKEPKKDVLGFGSSDSTVGWMTLGGLYPFNTSYRSWSCWMISAVQIMSVAFPRLNHNRSKEKKKHTPLIRIIP